MPLQSGVQDPDGNLFGGVIRDMATREEKAVKETTCKDSAKSEELKQHPASVCSICGKPATQLVDGDPSCAEQVEQVYEHQVEDFTRSHLSDWRK